MIMSIVCMEKSSNINIRMMAKCRVFVLALMSSLIYISYGGLLMSLEGELKHMDKIKYGDRVYCLIRRIH